MNIREEAMDDDDDDNDDETKYWTNGNDAEKSKSKQQCVGESVLSHILREVILKNVMVIESVMNVKLYFDLLYTVQFMNCAVII